MSPSKKNQNIHASAEASAKRYEEHKAAVEAKNSRRKADNRFALLASAGAVALAIVLQFVYFGIGPGQSTATPDPSPTVAQNSDLVPSPTIAEGREWIGTIEVGGQKLEVVLDGKNAPQATANFISLSSKNFYTDVSCHRITTAGIFVLQCGDPNGDGSGGPGYNWGPVEAAPENDTYAEGTLAMARRGGDGSSMGSQFFIVYKESMIPSDAAGGYTVFGKITKGLDKLQPVFEAGTADGTSDGNPATETKLGTIALN